MRRAVIALIAVLAFMRVIPAPAEEKTVSKEEFEQLQNELSALQARIGIIETSSKPGPRAVATEADNIIISEHWREGFLFSSPGGDFSLRFGGRIHIDGAFFNADESLEEAAAEIPSNDRFESGWELRHPRIYLKGQVYDNFLYKLEYTFSDDVIGDAYLGAARVPFLGTVILGKAARAFGLDPGPSSNYTLFMEYANTIIFGAGKQMGLAAGSPILEDRVSWAAQIFQFVDGKGVRTEDNYNLNFRLTGLPWYRDRGKRMLHLGGSYSLRSARNNYLLQAGPEVHLAPYLLTTGEIDMESGHVFAGEAAWVTGPFSLEGEWYASLVDRPEDLSRLSFYGFYLQSSFFLTGESRGEQYVPSYGEFDRPVRPIQNLDFSRGTWGAWQLAARYSYLDLNSEDIRAGCLGDLTIGLNWQLNPNLRWMLNYIHSHRNGVGDADIIATRFAVNI